MKLKMSSSKYRSLCLCHNALTHTGRDNVADIVQTMISNSFFKYDNQVKQMQKYVLRGRLENRRYFASTRMC